MQGSDAIVILPQADFDKSSTEAEAGDLFSYIIVLTPGHGTSQCIVNQPQTYMAAEVDCEGQKTDSIIKPTDPMLQEERDYVAADQNSFIPLTQQISSQVHDENPTQEQSTMNGIGSTENLEQQKSAEMPQANVETNGSPAAIPISHLHIENVNQEQGKNMHDLLQLFRQVNSEPLSSFVLQTPKHKNAEEDPQMEKSLSNLK
jgi:hypothetical protein